MSNIDTTSSQTKSKLIKDYQRSKADVGSPEVQIAILTARIAQVSEHLKTRKKDKMAQRGLLQMVGKRRRLLTYLESRNSEAYKKILKQLNLRR